MGLINDMQVDVNGGIQIKEYYSYYTYSKNYIGELCSDILDYISGYTVTNLYVIPYKNQNENFNINIYNEENVLILELSGTTINNWVTEYINSLATTGYTGYDSSEIEDRVIFDKTGNTFYKIEHIETGNTDSTPMWVIYNTLTEDYWHPSDNDYFYEEKDECGNTIGKEIVALIDANKFSDTYSQIKYIDRCPYENIKPSVETLVVTSITSTGATLNAEITDSGSSSIIERGFCYSILSNPDINDMKIINEYIPYTYNNEITNLITGKDYYVRAYAINSHGISYGNEITFKTLSS